MKVFIGNRYGKLVVIEKSGSKNNQLLWSCLCDCGITKDIAGSNLTSGNTQSCGCLRKEKATQQCKNRSTHGMGSTRVYNIWRLMKKRCLLDSNSSSKNYKGRGITVCKEWINSFETFYSWATSNGYNDGLTIEQVNNDLGYSPSNCTWITLKEQARNTTRSVLTHMSVLEIRKMLDSGLRNCEIAKIIGCHQRVISDIKHDRKWRDVR